MRSATAFIPNTPIPDRRYRRLGAFKVLLGLHRGVKLSVSLPDDDVAVLDEHARKAGLGSRSAALHQAIRLLRRSGFEDYAAAWHDWDRSGEREMWDDLFRRIVLMRRGEVRLVDLDPIRGSEANKQRPAVVVSNDRANAVAQRLGPWCH